MCGLLEALADHEEFCSLLDGLRKLPDERFDDSQWEALEAMLEILPAANEQLRVVFGERGTVDFSALNQAALHALGEDHLPTDLAFTLDARIQHLLVDEFQDTSHSQMELLRKLTREWSAGDDRTLFLVGDPMQSIYRFREAEVGLFLQTMRTGLPTVQIDSLKLTVNFRSRRNIVDWVNTVFPDVFAKEQDVALGAVRFSESVCASKDPAGPDVEVHAFWDPEGALTEGQPAAEAARVRAIVEQARANDKTVAVLARARGHLPHILAELRKAGQRYRAIEIDSLSASPAVLDLMALTAALLHPGDRVSWLAILRAPWCGLTLADLHALTNDRQRAAIQDLLADSERLGRLSEEGRRRAERLAEAGAAPRPRTLRAWVEGVWLRLGGPATVRDEAGLVDAEAYFDLLEKLDQGCDVDLDLLRQQVNRLFAAPDPGAGDGVEVMTIHKAKGLEFDVVVLPGLGRTAKTDDEKLMLWLENPLADGKSELLLAPMRSAAMKENAIYKYVQKLESQKEKHERERLLYVAATRARSELHLLGAVRVKDGVPQEPAKNTLLRLLWPAVQEDFAHPEMAAEERLPADAAPNLRRLSADWVSPPVPQVAAAQEAPQRLRPFRWEGQRVRLIGTVVHDLLQEIGREGAQAWTPERIHAARPRYEAALRGVGVLDQELADAADTVERAAVGAIEDERGRWILDGAHEEAWSEVSLAGVDDGRPVERRIDRTFIDRDGVRWVIDFKTSDYARDDVDVYLRQKMEEYRAQMEGYRALYRRLERRRVRIGLYFPLLGAWREYREYEESAAGAAL
jgi:ATP-dependent exoDNAse (exonuclease V) beta subunit